MTIIIDTSAFSTYGRGDDDRLTKWFKPEHKLFMPLIVIGELRAGFAVGGRPQMNEKLLQQFLDATNVDTLTISDKTTIIYAGIYHELRQAGTPIGVNDMWIAAITTENNMSLLTTDSDFSNVPNLKLIKI